MLKKIAIVSVIFASACIGDGVGGDPGPIPTDKGLSPSEQGLSSREGVPDMDRAPECADLPQDDSACAHACDEDALLSYIPEGTCATFSCPLANGETYVMGGCNN
jgi:hypothetical protein